MLDYQVSQKIVTPQIAGLTDTAAGSCKINIRNTGAVTLDALAVIKAVAA